MLTLSRNKAVCIASAATGDIPIEERLSKEWLLTNSRGGYSSSSIAGCNTRRYHGLLVGTLTPPANRIVSLSNCLETVIADGEELSFSTFEFSDRFTPEGFWHQNTFRHDIGAHFDFELGPVHMTKSVYLAPHSDAVAVVYDFASVGDGITFIVRPFAAMRNYHHLQKANAPLHVDAIDSAVTVRSHDIPNCQLILVPEGMWFEHSQQWWYNFVYRADKERGQDFAEDLWSPGVFKAHIEEPQKLVLWAHLGDDRNDFARFIKMPPKTASSQSHLDALCEDLQRQQSDRLAVPHGTDKTFKKLCLAADQFVIQRQIHSVPTATILAGFPWFMDWGRDAFIALPGLLLATERYDEAASVLTTFATAAEDGIIPNRFDDYNDQPHYNSIDASMWFIDAAFRYLETSGDRNLFASKLLPVIRWIIDCYYHGTKFGIHADADGLITGGNAQTQLTWMDAKCNEVVFTPRYGKAVEINALWYSALCRVAQYHKDEDAKAWQQYARMAEKAADGFTAAFWNDAKKCLYDCVLPDGTADISIRPNQIFAVSLPFSPLSAQQQKNVVETVRKYLLTPYGLRTLNTQDLRYHGRYTGTMFERDQAYHQGSVWPWLMGAFIEAHLRVNEFSRKSRKEAAEYLRPLLEHLTESGCIGSISEVFDGDEPHRPGGCFAQAWSIAEVMRAYLMIIG
jgi:predicted glycogen debranching enzyme